MAVFVWPPLQISTLPPVGGATSANQVLEIAELEDINTNTASIDAKMPTLVGGAVPVTGPLTDTQLRATPVPVSGPLTDTQMRATPVPVSGPLTDTQLRATPVVVQANAGTNLNTSLLALETTQVAGNTLIGSITETAPATDTASSGLNGRLQRIAQRLTSILAILPASLGQKTMANSLAVTLASDQGNLPVAQAALAATFQEITNLTTVAQTFTAPAGAKWAKVYADNTNTPNIRVKIGGTATTSSGISFEPGRSEDFSAVGNISVIAESGTNLKINVTFGA